MNPFKTFVFVAILASACQTKEMENVVVIGGGLMGSAAAWQLANYGEDVILIERQDTTYTFGSSFGEARISRSLGPKNDIFSYLHNTAVSETEKLIEFLNANDEANHSMEDIYTTSPVSYVYYASQSEVVKRLLRQQKDRHEIASTPAEAMERFGVVLSDTAMLIREYKRHTGTMNPKELIKKMHLGIQLRGQQVWYNTKVTGLKRISGGYKIELEDARTGDSRKIETRKVIAAAGPYNGILLKDLAPNVDKLITPKRVFLAFLKIDPSTYNNFSEGQKKKIRDFYPTVDLESSLMFSMIEKYEEDGTPLLKVGGHFKRNDIDDLEAVWKKGVTDEEVEWCIEQTLDYFKFLNIPLEREDLIYSQGYSCVYSLTQSEIPLLSNLAIDSQQDPNAILIGGMSGVGAKGALTYGLIGANLLLGKEDTSFMYQKTKDALGFERFLKDISELEK